MKNIYIYTNYTKQSKESAVKTEKRLKEAGFNVLPSFGEDAEMVIVFGGDGTFLHAIESCGYSSVPFLGVNTGHLGFFGDVSQEEGMDTLIRMCSENDFVLQPYKLLKNELCFNGEKIVKYAFNEICLRSLNVGVAHMRISVGENFVEHFSGDGIVIASSAGSTGYNYSLGGAIVDPRLEVIQLTPMAPISNKAFRSFTSSLLFPSELSIRVTPTEDDRGNILIANDGTEIHRGPFDSLTATLSDKVINVMRCSNYDFWSKVQDKFL